MNEEAIDFPSEIVTHSAATAEVAEGNFAAPVVNCPGWDVAELLRHLVEVHWFWRTIVAERLTDPPDESRRPAPPADEVLIETYTSGYSELVRVLRAADPREHVWTWAPESQNAGFVLRHQVQEAAVHHFDAARAAGRSIEIAPAVAADSVEEFLTYSVSSEQDRADPPRSSMGGSFSLVCTDAEMAWMVRDGNADGTVAFERAPGTSLPGVSATACELLLWLYERVELDTSAINKGVLKAFRGLTFTD